MPGADAGRRSGRALLGPLTVGPGQAAAPAGVRTPRYRTVPAIMLS